ncbi:MAG: helix-turn-helix domain-containing protein [Candidatus Jordarchaeales archaeon]
MRDLISQLEDGRYNIPAEPWRATSKSLTLIIPILAMKPGTRNYVVLEEVKDKVKIEDTGSIREAKVKADTDKPVFIPGGTMLKGSTQARATQFGIVIAGGTEKIPVHCVHASRAIRPGAKFTPSGRTPVKVYAFMLAYRNQSYTWAAVSNYASQALSHTPTLPIPRDDLVSVVEQTQKFREDLKELLKNIPSYVNQVGVIVIDNEGILGLEMYDHPDSWKAFEESIIKSYADALTKEDKTGIFQPDINKIPDIIRNFLDELKKALEEEVFNRGGSKTVLIKFEGYAGEYTLLNGKTIHLTVARVEKQMEYREAWAPRMTRRATAIPTRTTTTYPEMLFMSIVPSQPKPLWSNKWKATLTSLETPKTWGELTSELKFSKATISSHLKTFQSMGLVEKSRDPNGATRYRLTAYGSELKKKLGNRKSSSEKLQKVK